ncbi:MAG: DUF5654 family protein [Candidatus Micrarchaeia archaeon]
MAEEKTAKDTRQSLKTDVAREARREISARVITMLTTALAVVAGLFWQTAITDTIKIIIPVSGAWQYEIAIAVAFTIAAASMIYLLTRQSSGPDGGRGK